MYFCTVFYLQSQIPPFPVTKFVCSLQFKSLLKFMPRYLHLSTCIMFLFPNYTWKMFYFFCKYNLFTFSCISSHSAPTNVEFCFKSAWRIFSFWTFPSQKEIQIQNTIMSHEISRGMHKIKCNEKMQWTLLVRDLIKCSQDMKTWCCNEDKLYIF